MPMSKPPSGIRDDRRCRGEHSEQPFPSPPKLSFPVYPPILAAQKIMPKLKTDAPLPLDGGRSIVFGTDLVRKANTIPSPLTGEG